MARLEVTVLAFGEHQRAELAMVGDDAMLIHDQHLYRPDELPGGATILVGSIPGMVRGESTLIEAARRQGFVVEEIDRVLRLDVKR